MRPFARLGVGDGRGPELDETAIREFLATEYPRVVAGVALACGSYPVAEDAVQEAVARAWERGERGEHIDSPKAWVTAVAMNLVRSNFRRVMAERRARTRLTERAAWKSPADGGARVDLERALAALPRRQREAVVLRYYLDMDVREVAGALRVNEGTAKTTLHRARRALARALGDTEIEEANDRAGH
jgi:RNA polymerase sigma-70 factor, ECF subfamily